MINTLTYKDFIGTVEYSPEDHILYGKVIGVNGLVSYEGASVESLEKDFREAVEDYIDTCKKQNIEYFDKSLKGSFNVRITPELHRQTYLLAKKKGLSLNKLVQEAIQDKVHGE